MFPLYRNQSVRFTDLMNPFHGSSLLLNPPCRLQKTSGFLPDENDPAFAGILFFFAPNFYLYRSFNYTSSADCVS